MTNTDEPRGDTREQVLNLRGISKHFGAVSALTDIDLDVHAGEVVALVGDNGAGKSTLVKILAGVHQPNSGSITFRGQPVTLDDPSTALGLGIATVFQDLALCENLDVVANIFLGRELTPLRVYANRSLHSPEDSARPSPSRARCYSSRNSSSLTSRRPLSASPRRLKCWT